MMKKYNIQDGNCAPVSTECSRNQHYYRMTHLDVMPVFTDPTYTSVHGPPWYPPPEMQYDCHMWGGSDFYYYDYSTMTPRYWSSDKIVLPKRPIPITAPPDKEDAKHQNKEGTGNGIMLDKHKRKSNKKIKTTVTDQKQQTNDKHFEQTRKTKVNMLPNTKKLKVNINLSQNLSEQAIKKNITPKKTNMENIKCCDLEIDVENGFDSISKKSNELCSNIIKEALKEMELYDNEGLMNRYDNKILKECVRATARANSLKMSSSDTAGVEKSSPQNQTDTLQCYVTKPVLCEEMKIKRNRELKFIPPQLYKIKRAAIENGDRSSPANTDAAFSESSATTEDPTSTTVLSSPSTGYKRHLYYSTPNSSVYLTPESSPTVKTPEVLIQRRFKRSFSDYREYEDDLSSPNTSLDSSVYYTPDCSPTRYGSPMKRFKPRWSGSRISFNTDASEYWDGSCNSSLASRNEFQPELIGYQMVGDSQFCRYGQQLLGLERISMPNSPGRIGICVSGQTITDLHRRVKEKSFPISDKIILMIGTNDFLRSVDVSTMCKELSALIQTLQETVMNIVLLTLPPIPKLEKKYHRDHFMSLEKYNNYIRNLEDGERLRIADVSPMFFTSPPYQRCRMHLYELFFAGPQRRQDLIHLNRHGLEVIRKYGLLLLRIKINVSVLQYDSEEQLVEDLEKEVLDYAVRIGINPETEKYLLNIARDGLMSPLPEGWKACFDKRVDRHYYYNAKTQITQWVHPLDKHFENLVKKKRQEESISAGDDDSKTSIKDDLKSFEESVTTSDMIPSHPPADTHKSRLAASRQMSDSHSIKDHSPDGKKVLNPIGRPPLPPKRRPSSTSPKRVAMGGSERGTLSLRLSPSPSPTRIDIDSIGVPLGLPSPEVKSEKQATTRTPAIKLTGGGSAFLKSKQKHSFSLSDETKLSTEEPAFENVKEAESLDTPEDDRNIDAKVEVESKLKHSVSLGDSGFDKLLKTKRLTSLHESLLTLKQELQLPNSETDSPSTNAPLALRGILREKSSPTAKLWDIDPFLLTSEEKEKLRFQEFKDEKKQNVRFADIEDRPINIEFSKTDSEDESNTNDFSHELDDFIVENMYCDDDMKKDKLPENLKKTDKRTDLSENAKTEHTMTDKKSNNNLLNRKEANKNILSRITDLQIEPDRKSGQEDEGKRIVELENNNKKDCENWLSDVQDINQNEHKIQKLRKEVLDNTKLKLDLDNNAIEKHITEVGFAKSHNKKEQLKFSDKISSPIISNLKDILDKDSYNSLSTSGDEPSPRRDTDLSRINEDFNNDNASIKSTGEFHKSKLMPKVDFQKVFENMRDSVINSAEQSDTSEEGNVELMQTSPLGADEVQSALEQNEDDLRKMNTGVLHKADTHISKRFAEYKDQQRRLLDERKAALQQELEEDMEQTKKELKHQESIEKQRLYMEVQQSVSRYKEEIESEKNERETDLRAQCEDFLKELEVILKKDKVSRVKKMEEDHEAFLKEQEKKIKEEKYQFEEETKIRLKTSSSQLEKIITDLKEKEQKEVMRLKEESSKRIEEVRCLIETEQAEQELKHKQELAIVEADYKRILIEKQTELEKLEAEKDAQLATVKLQHQESSSQLMEQHRQSIRQLQDQCQQEEEFVRRKHVEKMEALNAQLSRVSEKDDITLVNRKLATTLSSDDPSGENPVGTPKTIKRRPKTAPSMTTTSSGTAESNSTPETKSKNVWNPSPQQRREGVSSAEDNHTSVSEEIQLEQDDCRDEKWTQSALSPLDNLRKQLEKLDDLEEKFPTSVHTDTYLRYPFSGPGASCELEFYRHRLHLERESVRRAKQALADQRLSIESRQMQLRHKQHTETLHQLHQEERELTDMEVSLHRTRALLGEKIIRLRYLEQSIERAAAYSSHHSHDTTTTTNTDSSGFSGSDLDLSNTGHCLVGRTEMLWTENVLQSLENINSEIREIWTILGKQQVPGLGPPPVLNYESRGIGQGTVAPHRATDIAERTRKLKEWLIRTRDQKQTHMIAPVTL